MSKWLKYFPFSQRQLVIFFQGTQILLFKIRYLPKEEPSLKEKYYFILFDTIAAREEKKSATELTGLCKTSGRAFSCSKS